MTLTDTKSQRKWLCQRRSFWFCNYPADASLLSLAMIRDIEMFELGKIVSAQFFPVTNIRYRPSSISLVDECGWYQLCDDCYNTLVEIKAIL